MSRADELLSQYQSKITQVGQWIAIRRYTGTGGVRTGTDTLAKAYINYQPAKEFVGSVVQNYAAIYALADSLMALVPQINTNDKLVTAFTGFDDLGSAPSVNEEGKVSGGKETAIFSIEKRAVSGKTIALKISAVG
jgi:hypothetical protein